MVSGSLPVPAKAAAVCTSGETSGYPSIGGERGGAEEALGLGGGSGKAASRGKAGVGMSSVPLPTKGVGVGTGIVFPALGRRDRVVGVGWGQQAGAEWEREQVLRSVP